MDSTTTVVIACLVVIISAMAGCVTYDMSERKQLTHSYVECLQVMRLRNISDVSLFCDKIKERL